MLGPKFLDNPARILLHFVITLKFGFRSLIDCFYQESQGSREVKVKLNGKQAEIEVKTVLDLLQAKKIEPQMVAVELNEKMLERENFSKTPLHEGDQIELHYFMGGG